MIRKQRFWICKKCGRVRKRYKSHKDEQPICCRIDMQRSRSRDKGDKISSRIWYEKSKIRDKVKRFEERYYSEVRDCCGSKIRVSKETKKLWKEVIKSKLRPTIIERAQKWLESLTKDSNVNYESEKEKGWAKSIDWKTGMISRSRGGFGCPKLQLKENGGTLHGEFRAGILIGGVFIDIYKDKPINEIKKTLLHEALHYLDSRSKTPSNHDCYFQMRLNWMEKRFNI